MVLNLVFRLNLSSGIAVENLEFMKMKKLLRKVLGTLRVKVSSFECLLSNVKDTASQCFHTLTLLNVTKFMKFDWLMTSETKGLWTNEPDGTCCIMSKVVLMFVVVWVILGASSTYNLMSFQRKSLNNK